jgi:hypothetical protein
MESSHLVSVREAVTKLHERGFETRQDGETLYARIDEDADEIPFAIELGGIDSEALRVVLAAEDGEFEDDDDGA